VHVSGFNDQSEPQLIVDAQTSLPMPPTAYGVLPSWWDRDDAVISEFDLDLWGSTTMTLTSGELVAAIQHPLTYADNTIASLDHTTDVFNETAHGLKTGDGPIQLTTSGVLPAELALATNYWVIRTGADTFKVASSLANALAGTVVAFGDNGTGTVSVAWHSSGRTITPTGQFDPGEPTVAVFGRRPESSMASAGKGSAAWVTTLTVTDAPTARSPSWQTMVTVSADVQLSGDETNVSPTGNTSSTSRPMAGRGAVPVCVTVIV